MTLPDPALQAAARANAGKTQEQWDNWQEVWREEWLEATKRALSALGGRVVVEKGCDKHGIFEAHSYPHSEECHSNCMWCPGGEHIVIWEGE